MSPYSADNPTPPRHRLQIRASLGVGGAFLLLLALIDSGTEDNLLDEELAIQVECKLEMPVTACALDGSVIAKITHRTSPVYPVLSGNQGEHLISYIQCTTNVSCFGSPMVATSYPLH